MSKHEYEQRRLARFQRELEFAQGLVRDMEANMTAMEASSKAFSKVFAGYRKKNDALLEKATKRVADQRKKIDDANGT
jgi:hypothetical protein